MNNVFPQRLQHLRERRRISRKVLSELCGLSKNMIARYERGEKEPSLGAVITIAEFFEVSIDDIVGREKKFLDAPYRGRGEW